MKTKLFISLLFVSVFVAKAQIHEKGNVLLELNYGGPDWITSVLKTFYNNSDEFKDRNVSVNGSGVVAAKFEYLITKRIGIGLMGSYSGITVKFSDKGTNYTAKVSGVRLMPALSIHMGKSAKFDPYFTFGMGSTFWNVNVESNDSYYKQRGYGSITLFAFRTEFGVRYFITDHFGISGNLGLGAGSILGVGVVGKF